MLDYLTTLFIANGFLPHGYCFSWSPPLLWTTVIANVLVGVAYYTIPVALLIIARKRPDIGYHRMMLMFAAFILFCGTTHFLDVISIWQPIYWLDAGALVATAAISLLTAVALWRGIPDILALPSAQQLTEANAKLSAEIAARRDKEQELQASEHRLRTLTENLEALVKDRTAQLAEANERMRAEVSERQHMQNELQVVNRKLEEALHRQEARSNEMEELNKIGDLLQNCLTTDEVAKLLGHFAASYLDVPAGAMYLIDAGANSATMVSSWGEVPENEQYFDFDSCWALRRGQLHPTDDWQHKLHCPHVVTGTEHVCVPLIGNGETLGLLHLRNPRVTHDTPFLEGVAKRAALALGAVKARAALVDDAMHDPLTGLYNRRHLDTVMQDIERRARRNEREVGLMMLDLDHFKLINDSHGHDVGDAVLREFAHHLKASLRPGDIACRFGGEEFIVILDGASLAVTHQRAEQFRQTIEQVHVAKHDELLRFTVSIGIAVFPGHGQHLTETRRQADAALYAAKQAGRNRTAVAGRSGA